MRLYQYQGRSNLAGRRIQQAREEAGLSQEQLAARMQLLGIELGQNAVSRIERGLRVVPDFELKWFAVCFQKPVEWFLAEEG